MPFPHSTHISRVLPTLSQSQGVLFFGGSFDPPHAGHIDLPIAVLDSTSEPMGLDSIVYVPAARSPHKVAEPTPPNHRIKMLELAIQSCSNAQIWTGELDRAAKDPESPSYWCETWSTIRESRAGAPDRFLIGADQALSMHRWFGYEQFWRDAIVVFRDEQDDPDSLIDDLQALGVWSVNDLKHWRSQIVQVPMIDASSTSIRSSLADLERRENPIVGLDDRVHKYILENGLYLP